MTRRLDALTLDPADNVATALRDLTPGERVRIGTPEGERALTVAAPVPVCHKLALEPLAPGELARKYGEAIGEVTAAIGPGEHVHVHNLRSRRARR